MRAVGHRCIFGESPLYLFTPSSGLQRALDTPEQFDRTRKVDGQVAPLHGPIGFLSVVAFAPLALKIRRRSFW